MGILLSFLLPRDFKFSYSQLGFLDLPHFWGFPPFIIFMAFLGAISWLGKSNAEGRGQSGSGPHPRRYDRATAPPPPAAPCYSWLVLIKINDLLRHSLGSPFRV